MAYSIRIKKIEETGQYIGLIVTSHGSIKTEPCADRATAYQAGVAKRNELTAANKARKVNKLAAGMTCQCCGRKHLANTGVMAHHGYQRPGQGWQTASCYGARHLPFEVSRDTLGMLIEALKSQKARMVEALEKAHREEFPLTIEYPDYNARPDAYGKRPMIRIEVTRETFDTVKAQHAQGFRRYVTTHDFDAVKERDILNRTREIRNITDYINDCEKRYNEWRQTYSGFDKETETWIKI